MVWLKAFSSGFLATLLFHQTLFGVLYLAGIAPAAPFNMNPVQPLGVPAVVSLSFFGGLWGLLLWAIIGRFYAAKYWSLAVLVGAIGPTAVAMLLVFPMKGIDVSASSWIAGLLLNGFWGFGTALLLKLMKARTAS